MPFFRYFILLICTFLLISCANQTEETKGPDYQQTKTMVLDVIHTDEGKKVLQQILQEPEFKQQMVMNQSDMEKSIQKSMSQSKQDWENMLSSPRVAVNLFKTTESQQKEMIKNLMKDPEYQKMMLDVFKDPQFSQHLLQLMKSQEYRKETMKIMEELVKTPSFQQKVMKLSGEGSKQQEQDEESEDNSEEEEGEAEDSEASENKM